MKCPDCGETDRYVFAEGDEVCYCRCGKEFVPAPISLLECDCQVLIGGLGEFFVKKKRCRNRMRSKLVYINEKEAGLILTTLSFQLTHYDIPQKKTKGREHIRSIILRLHKAFPKKKVNHILRKLKEKEVQE